MITKHQIFFMEAETPSQFAYKAEIDLSMDGKFTLVEDYNEGYERIGAIHYDMHVVTLDPPNVGDICLYSKEWNNPIKPFMVAPFDKGEQHNPEMCRKIVQTTNQKLKNIPQLSFEEKELLIKEYYN